MARFDDLARKYKEHIQLPWKTMLSDQERVIMVVYDRTDERKLPIQIKEFEMLSTQAGHAWLELDVRTWMADYLDQLEYRDEIFANPEELDGRAAEIAEWVLERFREVASRAGTDAIVALWGLSAWFGFLRVSDFLQLAAPLVKGRLVLFFPGEYYQNNYRFLEARDGWGYRAVPISL